MLLVRGRAQIPPQAGHTFQIVTVFEYALGNGGIAPGPMVANDINFALGNQAACGGPVLPIPITGKAFSYQLQMPSGAMTVPPGGYVPSPMGMVYQPRRTFLTGKAILFIDGFGVSMIQLPTFPLDR